ncbi:MAG: M24 family metallopeptidase [Acidimicrobiia bacterium]
MTLAALDASGREGRVRAAFAGAGIDALLVTKLVNIRWLTGFTGTAAMVLLTPDRLVFVTDGRYEEQAAGELGAASVDAQIEIGRSMGEQHRALTAAAGGYPRIGLEADHVSWTDVKQFGDSVFTGHELVATRSLVERPRAVKDTAELERMQRAANIASDALQHLLPLLGEAVTEERFAFELDTEMGRRGAQGPSFPTIIASGPNAARPHHRPTQRVIGRDELVVVDFGARFDGYCSDMTRTVVVGEIDPERRRMLDVVTAAEAAGVATVRPGIESREVDAACRTVIGDAGLADKFVHGTGHGVGLEIHEDPRVGSATTDLLAVGHVVTVEPGVYVAGVGGVRVEDSVVITPDGCRPLTHTAKELRVEPAA